ncbi:DUF3311 domain-containing protein [Acidisoma sp. C75]
MARKPPTTAWAWRLLLLLPFIGVLAVGCYNSQGPSLWGFPFFYWYQMLWVILCAVIIAIVFWREERDAGPGDDA